MDLFHAVVLIPSLHPDHLLTEYVADLVAKGFHRIVVVDDGSGPEYADLFSTLKEYPQCEVIGYAVNGGKGHALKYGMRHIQKHYPDVPGIITADSDGQHTATDVRKVSECLMAHPNDLILGSRDFKVNNVPFTSRAGNRLTSFFFALLYGKWLPDTQTGLRGFSMSLVPLLLKVPGDRFEYEMNMLIIASSHHIKFRTVNIQTIYIEENRRTHFRPFHDSARIYIQLFKNFFKYASSSGLSTVIDIGVFTLLDKWLLPLTGLNPHMTVLGGLATLNVLISNGLARSASSMFNYKANKSFVFRAAQSKGSFLRYVILAVCVWAVSSAMISLLNGWLGWDRTLLKRMVDTLLFFVNYRLQRAWVFASQNQRKDKQYV